MRRQQQIALAEALREHRERLDEIVTELAERGEPISRLEAKLIVDAGNLRLSSDRRGPSERRGREDGWTVESPAGEDPAKAPLSWTEPRIGVLRHYEPKPLTVPRRYLDAKSPETPPTIAIVTPSHQQGRYLDRTLYSVVSQKYPALEYVVQDGGSTDGTLAVLGRFGPLLTSWSSEPDSGQADAINRGFAQTSGELMAWLNSDDLLLPGTLAYVGRYFAEHPDVDVVYGYRVHDRSHGRAGRGLGAAGSQRRGTDARRLRPAGDALLAAADLGEDRRLRRPELRLRARLGSAAALPGAGAKMVRLPRFLGAFRIHAAQKTTALDNVGVSETDRLRLRVHGRPVPIEEVLERLRPYFARHVLLHTRQRIADRLPHPRVPVTVEPVEPWLRTPAAERLTAEPFGQAAEPATMISPLAPPAPGTPLPDGTVADEHGHAVVKESRG